MSKDIVNPDMLPIRFCGIYSDDDVGISPPDKGIRIYGSVRVNPNLTTKDQRRRLYREVRENDDSLILNDERTSITQILLYAFKIPADVQIPVSKSSSCRYGLLVRKRDSGLNIAHAVEHLAVKGLYIDDPQQDDFIKGSTNPDVFNLPVNPIKEYEIKLHVSRNSDGLQEVMENALKTAVDRANDILTSQRKKPKSNR